MTVPSATFTSRLRRRAPFVYAVLFAIWVLVIVWQVLEHAWVANAERATLIRRSEDIAMTLSLVIRSQRRFGSIVSQERLESALTELEKSGKLLSVVLLNASGESVVTAGAPISTDTANLLRQNPRWDNRSVTFVNPVDLGASLTTEGETNSRPTIVLSRRDATNPPYASAAPLPWRSDTFSTNATRFTATITITNPPSRVSRSGFGRPFWLNEKEYQELTKTRGLQHLIVAMSTDTFNQALRRDWWVRFIIITFAGIAVLGLGLAWKNIVRFSDLNVSLLRASEMNTHLREMNIAAAGLAHETRNPLNIVRGLAQMISREPGATTETRDRARQITDEVDRVTAQLNEFINYSRPREVRRAPVVLRGVLGDIARALQSDIEDKSVQFKTDDAGLVIEADEQMLRQVLFNLVINSIQAVEPGGAIEVVARAVNSTEAQLDVRDNGPGVAPEHRDKVFKPYFTTQPKGAGLGLAVVQQIALAHGWDVACLPNDPRGAIFRISRMTLTTRT
jgi:signal transduction histidine kinase